MSRNREFLVGAVIIAAVFVGVGGTLWLQGTNFGRPALTVEALLESVGQLSEGNPVTYRGVTVGSVSSIGVEPGATAVRVTMILTEPLDLPEDAGVVLGPESLFGDWQAEIVSQGRFERFSFYEVPEGTQPQDADSDVPVIGGYALPEITRLTASAEQISLNLADLTARLELAFNQETADNLASAITNIDAITHEVRELVEQQSEVAASITASADSALAEVAVAARAARTSFERIDGVLSGAEVDSLLTNMRIASAGIRDLATELADPDEGLGSTLERADSAFATVNRIAARLEAGEGSLGRLLVDTTFAVNAEQVLQSLDLLLQDVRENPGRYVRLSIF
jgi:phospholipid/cholesterol/gamma-HCH transport system substrate-binding protein